MGNVNVTDIGTLKESIRDMVKIHHFRDPTVAATWYTNRYKQYKSYYAEIKKWFAEEIEKQSESRTE